MFNPFQTQSARILEIKEEGSNSKLFVLKPEKPFKFYTGQFVIVSMPGAGEAPISICSDFNIRETFELTVRNVGKLTSIMHELKKGGYLAIRGPYGRPFPAKTLQNRNLLIVAGGCGIEPLRPIILDVLRNRQKYKNVQLFYGVRDESCLIFANEHKQWQKKILMQVALDQPIKRVSGGPTAGRITVLFDKFKIPEKPVVFLCGPPIMYKFVIEKLKTLGVVEEDIYLSLERRMHCGIGICEHCGVGSKYVCKDGPVFCYAEIKNEPGAI